jgi:hypothetical protein
MQVREQEGLESPVNPRGGSIPEFADSARRAG